MKNRFDVSVIVPVFNGEAFIERTLRSALSQTYAHVEIIVVDDGSSDGTPAILDEIARGATNMTVRRVPNGGVARARNVGTEHARTEFVAYLDADDLWHPTKIEEQMAAMRNHDGDPAWAGWYVANRIIDEDDRLISSGPVDRPSGAFFGSHLVINHIGNGSNILVLRAAALDVGGFDPSYADQGIGGCEDWDFQLRLLKKYKIQFIDKFLVGYRIHQNNMSKNDVSMALGYIAVMENFTSDPQVPDRLRRLSRSAAYRFAAPRLFRAGRYRDGVRALALVATLAPVSSAIAEVARVSQKVWGKLARLRTARRDTLQVRPLFMDLDPKQRIGPGSLKRPRWLLRTLADADRAIAAATPIGRDGSDGSVAELRSGRIPVGGRAESEARPR